MGTIWYRHRISIMFNTFYKNGYELTMCPPSPLHTPMKRRERERENTACRCRRSAVGCLIDDKKFKSTEGHYSEKNAF